MYERETCFIVACYGTFFSLLGDQRGYSQRASISRYLKAGYFC